MRVGMTTEPKTRKGKGGRSTSGNYSIRHVITQTGVYGWTRFVTACLPIIQCSCRIHAWLAPLFPSLRAGGVWARPLPMGGSEERKEAHARNTQGRERSVEMAHLHDHESICFFLPFRLLLTRIVVCPYIFPSPTRSSPPLSSFFPAVCLAWMQRTSEKEDRGWGWRTDTSGWHPSERPARRKKGLDGGRRLGTHSKSPLLPP